MEWREGVDEHYHTFPSVQGTPVVSVHSLYSVTYFLLLSFSIPAQLTLFLALHWPTSATHCCNQVIVLMISATSCRVKWREGLVQDWIDGHRYTACIWTMKNASLNRLWLNRWWLKFYYRQENTCIVYFPPKWSFRFFLNSLFSPPFACGSQTSSLLMWLYLYILPHMSTPFSVS